MKKTLALRFLFISVTFFTLTALKAQTNFKSGYVILKSKEQIKGEIDFTFIQNTPNTIIFRNNKTLKTYSPDDLLEFKVESNIMELYRTFTVAISVSSDNIDHLEYEPLPKYATKTLFLRVMIEGNINLYSYFDFRYHYFTQKNTETPKELTYKRFETAQLQYRFNDTYKNELRELVKDNPSVNTTNFDKVSFIFSSISKVIIQYNGESNKYYYQLGFKFPPLVWSLKAGINGAQTGLTKVDYPQYDFKGVSKAQIGLSIQTVLPIIDKKRFVFVQEFMYHKAALTSIKTPIFDTDTIKLTLNTLRLNSLIRYKFVDKSLCPFVNLGVYNGFLISNKINSSHNFDYFILNNSKIPKHTIGYSFGGGLEWGKWSAEYRYESGKLFGTAVGVSSKFTAHSFLLGFQF